MLVKAVPEHVDPKEIVLTQIKIIELGPDNMEVSLPGKRSVSFDEMKLGMRKTCLGDVV